MSGKNAFETEIAELIIESLNLEDMQLSDIEPEAALFNDGLALDSIDALELAMSLSVKYGFKIKSDDPNNKEIFSSLRALAKHVALNKK